MPMHPFTSHHPAFHSCETTKRSWWKKIGSNVIFFTPEKFPLKMLTCIETFQTETREEQKEKFKKGKMDEAH